MIDRSRMLSFGRRKTSPPLVVISLFPLFFLLYPYCIVAAPFLNRCATSFDLPPR